MSTPRDIITEKLNQPKKASDDAGSMEQFSLDELIQAARFIAGEEAAEENNPGAGINFQKIVPPGSV